MYYLLLVLTLYPTALDTHTYTEKGPDYTGMTLNLIAFVKVCGGVDEEGVSQKVNRFIFIPCFYEVHGGCQ